jgi:hypothetical protein
LLLSVGLGNVKSLIGSTNWGDFSKVAAQIPSGVISAVAAVLGAVALIAIFTTGLLLDLVGSWLYRAAEMTLFQKHAKQNAIWMEKLVNLHQDYIQNDWKVILSAPTLVRDQLLICFKGLLFWSKRFRNEYVDAVRKLWTLRSAYTRVQAFLLAYVLLSSRAEKLELVSTQISLWNTSRAIATSMYLVGVEALVYRWPTKSVPFTLVYVVFLGMAGIATLITKAAFSRVCSTLFSLAYITNAGSTNRTKAAAVYE